MLTRTLARPLTALPAVVLLLGLAACGDSDDSGDTEAGDDTSSSAPEESPTATESGSTDGECAYAPDGSDAGVTPPPGSPAYDGEVPVTLTTSVGELQLTLDAASTPCTVNSFLSLAEQGYFDGSSCHRMTTQGIFVLQCGDPSGTGAGTPGYSYADELSGDETYSAGTLAMANAGPNTNGSQFFIVYGDSPLDPLYNVFGTVDADTVKTIEDVAKDGTTPESDGAPNTPVEIESVTQGQ